MLFRLIERLVRVQFAAETLFQGHVGEGAAGVDPYADSLTASSSATVMVLRRVEAGWMAIGGPGPW